jgi:glycosyltransferase involved in cell wall biosynthesis
MPKRILIITAAGTAWPSGWVRALIYRDFFATHGVQVDYIAHQSPWLCKLLGRKGIKFNLLLNAGLGVLIYKTSLLITKIRERIIIRKVRKTVYDVIYLQKAGSYELATRLKSIHNGRIVFDLNDAMWLPSNSNYGNGKVHSIISIADAVTCDNPVSLKLANTLCKEVYLVPDPAQIELFDKRRKYRKKKNGNIIIGWIGSPGTLFNIFSVWEALEIVFSRHDSLELRLVGTGYNQQLLPRFEKVKFTCLPYYSQKEMIEEILNMDIGLFPLFEVEDSLSRGVLKGTLYMAGGVAVVASPLGQVCEIIQDGVNGMLANSKQEWVDKLEQLITNNELRGKISEAGLNTVRGSFNLEKTFHDLLKALKL